MKKRIFILTTIMLSLSLILTGAASISNEEIPLNKEGVETLSLDYSKSLSTGKIINEQNYSPMMKKLINERRDFYKGFFDIGLYSDLLSIESEYSIESITKDEKQNNIYKVKAVETVTINGKYRCSSPEDYPLVKVGKLALSKTENPVIKKEIEEYVESHTDSAIEFIKEGSFEIVNFLKHDLIIKSNKNRLMIIQDSFTDKAKDNPEGHDNISWVNNRFIRKKQDLKQMPDYIIWHTPIEELAENLLSDYSKELDFKTSTENVTPSGTYSYFSHSSATSYINAYTTNASSSFPCAPGNYSAYADNRFWNTYYKVNGKYPYPCADCADYVSQALKYGGHSQTSTWKWVYNSGGSYAWINVSGLKNFLINSGRGYRVSYLSSLKAGDVAFIPWGHVVMVGATGPHRYSAHTNDRRKYTWSSSINWYMKIKSSY